LAPGLDGDGKKKLLLVTALTFNGVELESKGSSQRCKNADVLVWRTQLTAESQQFEGDRKDCRGAIHPPSAATYDTREHDGAPNEALPLGRHL
jgi:hypothetical protein